MSNEEMGKLLGLSPRMAWDAKQELWNNDMIRQRRRIRGSNIYWLNPEFINNAIWHNVLKSWCDVYPAFRSIMAGISILFSSYYPPIANQGFRNKDIEESSAFLCFYTAENKEEKDSPSCKSGTQLENTISPEITKKGRVGVEMEEKSAFAAVVEAEASKGPDLVVVEKACGRLKLVALWFPRRTKQR